MARSGIAAFISGNVGASLAQVSQRLAARTGEVPRVEPTRYAERFSVGNARMGGLEPLVVSGFVRERIAEIATRLPR